MRKILLIIVFSILLSINAFGMTAHEQAMSYILADQDPPTDPGDYLYTHYDEEGQFLKLVTTTGYFKGSHGSHGDRMKIGYVAYTQESYGYAMEIHEAIQNDDGTYSLGEYIGLYEIKDCGYGKETGKGKSQVRLDKKSQGTIEAGLSVDTYFPTLNECKEWMRRTNGMIFVKIIPAKG